MDGDKRKSTAANVDVKKSRTAVLKVAEKTAHREFSKVPNAFNRNPEDWTVFLSSISSEPTAFSGLLQSNDKDYDCRPKSSTRTIGDYESEVSMTEAGDQQAFTVNELNQLDSNLDVLATALNNIQVQVDLEGPEEPELSSSAIDEDDDFCKIDFVLADQRVTVKYLSSHLIQPSRHQYEAWMMTAPLTLPNKGVNKWQVLLDAYPFEKCPFANKIALKTECDRLAARYQSRATKAGGFNVRDIFTFVAHPVKPFWKIKKQIEMAAIRLYRKRLSAIWAERAPGIEQESLSLRGYERMRQIMMFSERKDADTDSNIIRKKFLTKEGMKELEVEYKSPRAALQKVMHGLPVPKLPTRQAISKARKAALEGKRGSLIGDSNGKIIGYIEDVDIEIEETFKSATGKGFASPLLTSAFDLDHFRLVTVKEVLYCNWVEQPYILSAFVITTTGEELFLEIKLLDMVVWLDGYSPDSTSRLAIWCWFVEAMGDMHADHDGQKANASDGVSGTEPMPNIATASGEGASSSLPTTTSTLAEGNSDPMPVTMNAFTAFTQPAADAMPLLEMRGGERDLNSSFMYGPAETENWQPGQKRVVKAEGSGLLKCKLNAILGDMQRKLVIVENGASNKAGRAFGFSFSYLSGDGKMYKYYIGKIFGHAPESRPDFWSNIQYKQFPHLVNVDEDGEGGEHVSQLQEYDLLDYKALMQLATSASSLAVRDHILKFMCSGSSSLSFPANTNGAPYMLVEKVVKSISADKREGLLKAFSTAVLQK